MHIVSDAFYQRAREVFNPRNAMYISRNNGMLDSDVMPFKDTLISANTLNDLTLHNYSPEEIEHIKQIKARFNA